MTLGMHEEKEVVVSSGRFGPYIKWGEQFISIPKNIEPLEVDMDKAIELIGEKQQADAPVAFYEGKPVTKGKGRFGPFIKFEDLYINVPRRYDFENLQQNEIDELIGNKLDKEANRFIQRWEDEKVAIENGRWGPFIRFGKLMLKLHNKEDKSKFTAEELAAISLDDVKKMIVAQMPDAFEKKTTKKSKSPSKKSIKKTAPKKGIVKKSAPKKRS